MRYAIVIALIFCSTCRADGYDLSATYTADLLASVAGGLSTGTEYLDNLDLELEINTAEAWGIGGGRVFVHGLYNNSRTFSDKRVGDLQVVSNIDAGKAWRLFEFWYEFDKADWSLRTGLYDLNSEFDVNETGGLFLHSSHGVGAELGQTGHNGPGIFPVSSLSLRAEKRFGSLTARVAVLDAVPGDPADAASNEVDLSRAEGALSIAEIDEFGAPVVRILALLRRVRTTRRYQLTTAQRWLVCGHRGNVQPRPANRGLVHSLRAGGGAAQRLVELRRRGRGPHRPGRISSVRQARHCRRFRSGRRPLSRLPGRCRRGARPSGDDVGTELPVAGR